MSKTILDLQKLRDQPLVTAPFPLLAAQGVVRDEWIKELAGDFPPMPGRGLYPVDVLTLGPVMRRLVDEVGGEDFRRVVEEKFGIDLRDCPPMITLRGYATERDGHIHADSVDKIVTLLLYLNEPWPHEVGNLRMLRSPDDLESTIVEVPARIGSLAIFKVTPNGWHGHHHFIGERRVLMLNYMESEAALRHELKRHRFSAKVKGLRQRLSAIGRTR